MSAENFSAVLMNPIKYKDGIGAGFIVFPHSDAVPEGWGEPYFADDGSPIEPGTEGGPNPNRLVGYVDAVWKRFKNKRYQAVGNIDWRGPWKSLDMKKRLILTWNGPTARYWNPQGAFIYDGNPDAHEIYRDGKVLVVAPYPVLGAALTQHTDAKTQETVQTLVVLCKNGMLEEVYVKRPWPSPVIRENMTDAVRETMKLLKDEQNPNGWMLIATSYELEGSYAPDAPWFFNEEGTMAKTIKRSERIYTDELGEERTEDKYVEVTMTYTPSVNNALFYDTDESGQNTITYWQTCDRFSDRIWYDPDGHKWSEDGTNFTIFTRGTVRVAVDWDTDAYDWVYGFLDVDCGRTGSQYWTVGVDGAGEPNPKNTGSHVGYRYPPSDVPFIDDHTEQVWLGAKENVYLLVGPDSANPDLKFYLGWGLIGSKSMMFGGSPQDQDWTFAFWDSIDVHLHHLDLRSKLIVGYVRYDSYHYDDAVTQVYYYNEKMEIYGNDFNVPVQTGSVIARNTSAQENLVNGDAGVGWTRAQKDAWASVNVAQEIVCSTFQNRWSTINDDHALWEPDFKSFYYMGFWQPAGAAEFGVENTFFRRRELNDYLIHPDRCYREGVFATNEENQTLFSFKYVALDDKGATQNIATHLYPEGDLGALVSGDQYHQGGPV